MIRSSYVTHAYSSLRQPTTTVLSSSCSRVGTPDYLPHPHVVHPTPRAPLCSSLDQTTYLPDRSPSLGSPYLPVPKPDTDLLPVNSTPYIPRVKQYPPRRPAPPAGGPFLAGEEAPGIAGENAGGPETKDGGALHRHAQGASAPDTAARRARRRR